MLRIKKNEFIQNILKMFVGSTISQIVLIIGSLILARLYSPSKFGELSLYISMVSILAIVSTLRYENAIVIESSERKSSYLVNFLIFSSLIFSITLFVIFLFLDNNLLKYFKIYNFYYLIPIGIFIYALFQIFTNANVRDKLFAKIAKSKIFMAFFAVLFQILFYYLNVDKGLIYGYIIGYLVSVIILYKNIKLSLVFKNLKKLKATLTKYSYFPKHSLPADFINNLSANITPLLIVMWFDMKIAGLYFLSYRIVNLPLQLISISIGKVYFQKASKLFINEKEKLFNFTKKIIFNISLITIIPLLILFFFSENILVYILGAEWQEAGVYISLLTLLFFTRTLFSPISHIAEITKKIYIIFYFSIYILFITIGSFYIGYILNNFNIAITLYSISSSLGYLFLLIYFLKLLKRYRNEH